MLLIGLMSGTSADGIDVALVEISGGPPDWKWRLIAFQCLPWTEPLRDAILRACLPDATVARIVPLHTELGEKFAEAAQAVSEKAGISLSQIDAIASHGQTIRHIAPQRGDGELSAGGTLQIGDSAVIAARTGCRVVSDFRAADMALGGQGAPLVPFADYAFFASPQETRAVQNIGGIANVTYLPKNGALTDVLAFDTGPGNMVMDALVFRFTNGEKRFDSGGEMAGRGEVRPELLRFALGLAYFGEPPPKSTGRERFGAEFADTFVREAARFALPQADVLATAAALTAESIAQAYRDFLLPRGAIDTVIVGGGGAANATLMQMLAERIAPARLTTHAEFGLPDDAKEAVAFALLAYETLRGRPSNVPAATGATGLALLGKIALPPAGLS